MLYVRQDLKGRLVSLIGLLADTLIEDGNSLLNGLQTVSQVKLIEIENRQKSLETLFGFLGQANQDDTTRNMVGTCQDVIDRLQKKSAEALVLGEL